MAQLLRTADTDEKHAPNLKPVLRMPARAVEGQAFEQANTASTAAVEVQRRIGAAACEVTSRLSDLYSAARRQTANSCDHSATYRAIGGLAIFVIVFLSIPSLLR